MTLYEHVLIARPELSTSQVDALTEKVVGTLKEQGGKVEKTEYCGLKQFAYPIKKSQRGHYILLNLAAKPEAIAEMERKMRIDEDILRFLTLRVEEHDDKPSVLAQQQAYSRRPDFSDKPHGGNREGGYREKRDFRSEKSNETAEDGQSASAKEGDA